LVIRTKQAVENYRLNNDEDSFNLHRALGWIYETQIYTPETKPVFNQFDPTLMEIQRELETAWEKFEMSRIPNLEEIDMPEDPKEFQYWFKRLVMDHEAADHPLFSYLEKEASFEDMKEFFSQEITVDARFDDLVAFSQIGMDNWAKMELAENYWDEMGNGRMEEVHTIMFDNLLQELELTNNESLTSLFDKLTWEALACGNALLNTSLYRKNVYKALGCLGSLEMMAPQRFSRLVAGYKRIGLSQKAQEYHTQHVIIDTRHGNGWLRNAIVPYVKADPSLRYEIVKGAFYRLNTSLDYCNKLYDRFTQKTLSEEEPQTV
ncbi:iron-containing redox enzyme family protein, partial [Bacillus subtilis]